MLLSECKSGYLGSVSEITGGSVIKKKLVVMGVIPGSKIEVVKKAPFKGPIEIKIKGYCLSLRNEEAKNVEVTGGAN